MLKYKFNVLLELKQKGYTTTKLRKEKILGEKTIQKLRHNEYVSMDTLDLLCGLLGCNISDIIEYISNDQITDNR